MLQLDILGVSEGPHHPVVLLRYEERILPIVVGIAEANAIQVGLMQEKIGRPMTHDLICNLLAGLGGSLQSVSIYKLENDTFFAHLNVEQKNIDGQVAQIVRIDARPSDGIALAIRVQCPIYAAEQVMDLAGQDVSIISPPDEPEDPDEGDENDFNP